MNPDPLFEPFALKHLVLRNRFIMPAMQRGMSRSGAPTQEMFDTYRARAVGGIALVIGESTAVPHASADWNDNLVRIEQATHEAWKGLADAVHSGGAHFFVQLWHPGAIREVAPGYRSSNTPTLSPSGLMGKGRPNGAAMTRQELADVRDAFVEGALLAREAGADGIEVHACHGYLLDQFLWHETNLRQDEYGGAMNIDRARYPAEIVAAIRREVGPDFPISIRLSQFKEVDYGARIWETPEALGDTLYMLRQAGVDLFHMSARRFYRPAFAGSPRTFAGWAKSLTDAPVITVGSVGLTTDMLENLFDGRPAESDLEAGLARLREGFAHNEFDLVAVGRSLIAAADWVNLIGDGQGHRIPTFTKSMLGPMMEDEAAAIAPTGRVIVEDI